MLELPPLVMAVVVALLSGGVSGLIAWGGVKRDLFWLSRGVTEAKEAAADAHHRIDAMQGRAGRR